jgi:DNA-binding HxlR family transcriptional regulator
MSETDRKDTDRLDAIVQWCASLPLETEQQALAMMRRAFDKWSFPVLGGLAKSDAMRFSALARALPGITQKVLTRTLRDLEQDGLISRHVYPDIPIRVEYALTENGRGLLQASAPLFAWFIQLMDVECARPSFEKLPDQKT